MRIFLATNSPSHELERELWLQLMWQLFHSRSVRGGTSLTVNHCRPLTVNRKNNIPLVWSSSRGVTPKRVHPFHPAAEAAVIVDQAQPKDTPSHPQIF